MPKYTIIGDPHAKPDNLNKINQLIDLAESMGNQTIWLGDLLDTKEIVRASCLNTFYRRFKNSRLKHIILVGNHDQFHPGSTQHSLEPLSELSNVILVDVPTMIGNMLLLPYYHDLESFKHTVSESNPGSNVLIMHQGVNGCDYGNGFIAEKEIDLDELEKFKRVISGHFHRYQEKQNLIYLGTPFSHSFGESNQVKYIAEYDPVSDEITVIPTQFEKHMTYTVDANETTTLPFIPDYKNINRVVLTGTAQNIAKFEKSNYEGIRFIEQPDLEASEHTIKESDSPEEKFVKWAKEIKGLDEETIDLGLSILKDIS